MRLYWCHTGTRPEGAAQEGRWKDAIFFFFAQLLFQFKTKTGHVETCTDIYTPSHSKNHSHSMLLCVAAINSLHHPYPLGVFGGNDVAASV